MKTSTLVCFALGALLCGSISARANDKICAPCAASFGQCKVSCDSGSAARFPCLRKVCAWFTYRPLNNSCLACDGCMRCYPCKYPPLYMFMLNGCGGHGVERAPGPMPSCTKCSSGCGAKASCATDKGCASCK